MKKYIAPSVELTALGAEHSVMFNVSDSPGSEELTRQQEVSDTWENGWNAENWTRSDE